tara:strand:- start:18 stop:245 length:228 start_codon:yes stop_codon:yes gene_type:complete
MVNKQWKNRFEEVVHEKNNLESPNLLRKKELAAILLRHLEEELSEHETIDFDSVEFTFDDEVFRAIFTDPEYHKF